ncbi:SET domain-containing protein [Trametes gibbosa]|nr:SET domain-containing protein [Trametes gibbosa]
MNAQDLFVIQDIPGKGKGAIALQAIVAGQPILTELPLAVQHCHVTDQSIAAALSPLPRSDHIRFLSLSNAWKGSGLYGPLVGTWLTNALPCGTPEDPCGDDTEADGIFPIAARFNASCAPNVHHYWDEVIQKLVLRAVRDIAQGEELCLAYVDVIASRAERRAALQEYYNYECRCGTCSLTGQSLRESDRRRSLIARIRENALDYCDPAFGFYKVKFAIRLLREEGLLESHCINWYRIGFEFCALAGDVASASKWARKTWEATCILKGSDSSSAQYWQNFAEYPEDFIDFGKGDRGYVLQGPDV